MAFKTVDIPVTRYTNMACFLTFEVIAPFLFVAVKNKHVPVLI